MRILRSKSLVVVLVLTVSFLGGCDYLNPADVSPPETAKKTSKPPAPVVVDGTRSSYADIVEKSSPAVVQIAAVFKQEESRGGFGPSSRGPRMPSRGAGSGVIVSKDGTILTNHHVIDKAERITVEMSDGTTHTAEMVGSDKPSDLAVIKIKGDDYPFLKLGDSDEVRVGDIVLAIGNPLGIGQTVTSGIISAKGRTTGLGDPSSFQDFLQTDAPINQGNSGGALVNVKGELIGINSQILSRSGGSIGIGFAIPSNMATSVMDQLIKTGKVRRGMLGINIQNTTPEIRKQYGIEGNGGTIVSGVKEGGAAEKAGIKVGDVITEFNGEEIDDGNSLRNKVAATMPGTEIKISLIRDKKKQEIKVSLDEYDVEGLQASNDARPDEDAPEKSGRLGINVQPITPELASRYRIPSDIKGLVVSSVDPQGPAAEAGLREGDVIREVNRELIESTEDMRRAVDEAGEGAMLLLINRQGRTAFLTIRP
ncbi:MAG: DegQ family serine endoprotease [Pyrinomonadaceae bacterium]|nr:DegQ family serine endoprotease [Pyrinomonadaceae bacterium]